MPVGCGQTVTPLVPSNTPVQAGPSNGTGFLNFKGPMGGWTKGIPL